MYLPADSHEAFKFGVMQATEPIPVNNIADAYVNEALSEKRRKLLTEKVDKWAVVVRSPRGGRLAPAFWIFGDLHEGKTSAEHEAAELRLQMVVPGTEVSVQKIEIEVSI